MNWEEHLGVKISVLVSGIVGGIISLTFEQKISFVKALVMIFTGASTTAVTYPALESYFSIQPAFANGLGFLLGLIAMRLIDLIMAIVDKIAPAIKFLTGYFVDKVKANPAILLNPSRYGELFSGAKPNNGSNNGTPDSVHTTGSATPTSEKGPADEDQIHLL